MRLLTAADGQFSQEAVHPVGIRAGDRGQEVALDRPFTVAGASLPSASRGLRDCPLSPISEPDQGPSARPLRLTASASSPRPIPSIHTSLLTAMPAWVGQTLPGL